MDAWLPGVERIDSPWPGGTYLTNVPWRFVAHTTEVIPSSLAGAKAMAARHPHPPHLWAWPQRGWLGQTVPLDRSAAALVQPDSAPAQRTNKARAIQVEIIGNAAETPNWPKDWWEWLGSDVLAPVIAAGYLIDLDAIAPLISYPASYGATDFRFTWDEWLDFSGLCAHLNVPGNLHGDIGAGRLDLVAASAARTIDPQEDDMPLTAADLDAIGARVQAELRKGTGVGQPDWPSTNKAILGLVQQIKNDTARLADPAKFAAVLAPVLAEHLPDLGSEDLEEVLRRVLPDIRIELAGDEEG